MNKHKIIILGSGLRVSVLLLNTVVGFLLMPFVVHSLGDRLFGYWTLVGALVGYYGLLDLGIVSAVQFQVANALGKNAAQVANKSLSTAFVAFSALGLVAFLITIILAVMTKLVFHSTEDIWLFRKVLLIMGVGFAVGFPGRVFVGAISAHLRWDLLAAVDLAILLLRTLLIVVGIKAGGGLVLLAAVSVLTDAISICAQVSILYRIDPELEISLRLASRLLFKELIHYGGRASIIKIADQMRFYIDGWVVGIFVGVTFVTHYAIASRLSFSFMALLIAIVGTLSPWFSLLTGSKDHTGVRRIFSFGIKVSASISTIVAGCLLLYGRPFINVWMGSRYTDSFWPMAILVIAVFSDVSQQPMVGYLYGVSKHGFLAKVTLVEGVVNLSLSIFLAYRYGMIGVALGTMIPMLIAKLLILPPYACYHLRLSLWDYYVKILGRSALLTGGAIVVPRLLVFRYLAVNGIYSISLMILCQVFIALLAVFWVVFTTSERSNIFDKLFPSRTNRAIAAAD